MPKPPSTSYRLRAAQASFPGNDWMRVYLREAPSAQDLRASSRRAYESVWRSYLTFLARSGSDAVRAEPKEAAAFLKQYGQTTALRYGRLIERVYAHQVASGVVTENPFDPLRNLLAQEETRSPSPALHVESVEELLNALPAPADWQEHRDQAIVVLVMGAGLRLRELRELELTQLVPCANGLEVQPRGRTARSREIPLDPAAAEFLNEWLDVRRTLEFPSYSRLVFPSRQGKVLPVNTLYRRVRALLQHVVGDDQLPQFGIGVLRASFARRYQRTNAVVEAQHALGHRRITSTIRYFRQLKPTSAKRTP